MTLIQLRRTPAPPNTLSDLQELRLTVMKLGACRGAPDPDAWFPDDEPAWGDHSPEAEAARATYEETARALCRGCPVRALCLELALHEERELPRSWIHGVRGATTPWQRLRIRRSRRRAIARQTGKAA